MSEYVKIKRRIYDELTDTQAKYKTLCSMLESMEKVYHENKQNDSMRNPFSIGCGIYRSEEK